MAALSYLIPIILIANILSEINPPAFIWQRSTPEEQGMDSSKLVTIQKSLEGKGTKKLLIIKNDHIVMEWFAEGWEDTARTHYSASLAKALVGGMSLAVALSDGFLYPDMVACELIPEWKNHRQKSKITIRHLATHTSGLEDAEVNSVLQNQMRSKGLHSHMDLPGWKGKFWKKDPNPFTVSRDSTKVLFPPGSNFNYSNPGFGMLTYAVTASLSGSGYEDIRSLLWDRIYRPVGIEKGEFSIGYGQTYSVNGLSLVPSWGGGGFTANAAARLGRLMLQKGRWEGISLIDSNWVERVLGHENTAIAGSDAHLVSETSSLRTAENPFPTSTMGWYSNFDGVWEHVPRDAFVGAGAGHQILLVIPSLNLIVVRFGEDLAKDEDHAGFWGAAEKYLLNPVMDAIIESPYAPSSDILGCSFTPPEGIIRLAEGSDNWPLTWADDDNIYTAYGDGWGFDPQTAIKLSLGLAKVTGMPPNITGQNIRSSSGERVGQGKFGAKASGMLFIDETLYMLTRNTGNAQLTWSKDYGKTWTWADWTFDISFGCPTFLNFGKHYTGARDGYIYIYSQDDPSAYKITDQMVLARVSRDKIIQWKAYQYYAGKGSDGQPSWSEDIRKREAVFENPGKCYRSGISFNPGLQKYLWCQIIPQAMDEKGPRFSGGLGIFEAPEPWGPWKTVFYTRDWDVGPGETASIPPKWISPDGRTAHLVFSGDDYFSVREVKFQ